MLNHNMRFYLAGRREDAQRATIEIAWYLSGVGVIASVVETKNNNDEVYLNIISNTDREDYFVRTFKKVAEKHNMQGFQDWKDYRGSDE